MSDRCILLIDGRPSYLGDAGVLGAEAHSVMGYYSILTPAAKGIYPNELSTEEVLAILDHRHISYTGFGPLITKWDGTGCRAIWYGKEMRDTVWIEKSLTAYRSKLKELQKS